MTMANQNRYRLCNFDSYTFRDYCDKIYTIEEIQAKVSPIIAEFEIDEAWIFGSYAKGKATAKSDVDIAVRVSDNETLTEYLGLFDPITEALLKPVDIYDVREFKVLDFMKGAKKIYDRRMYANSKDKAVLHENI